MIFFHMKEISSNSISPSNLCCLSPPDAQDLLKKQPSWADIQSFVLDLRSMAELGRWQILLYLRQQELCVNDLAALMGSDQTKVSHQLKRLKARGWITYRKEGKMSFTG
jgi:predicted transcriptional regulator